MVNNTKYFTTELKRDEAIRLVFLFFRVANVRPLVAGTGSTLSPGSARP